MSEHWFVIRTKSEEDYDLFSLQSTDGIVTFVSSPQKQWMVGKSLKEVREYTKQHEVEGLQLKENPNKLDFMLIGERVVNQPKEPQKIPHT